MEETNDIDIKEEVIDIASDPEEESKILPFSDSSDDEDDSEPVFVCKLCGDFFDTESSMASHIGQKHPEKAANRTTEHKCEHCELVLKTGNSLRYHIFIKHTPSHLQSSKHQCDVCGKKFPSKGKLTTHLSQSHRPKSFQCTDCDSAFTSDKQLKEHILSKHVVKEYICEECAKVFDAAHKLNTHVKVTHQNERKFACDECDYRFLTRHSLDKHKKSVHQKVKDIPCEYCGKCFIEKGDRNRHVRNVHEKLKPHKCRVCDRDFGVKSTLVEHLRRKHGIENEVVFEKRDLSYRKMMKPPKNAANSGGN